MLQKKQMEPTELNLVEVVLELNEDGKAVYAVSSTWSTLLFFQHSQPRGV